MGLLSLASHHRVSLHILVFTIGSGHYPGSLQGFPTRRWYNTCVFKEAFPVPGMSQKITYLSSTRQHKRFTLPIPLSIWAEKPNL